MSGIALLVFSTFLTGCACSTNNPGDPGGKGNPAPFSITVHPVSHPEGTDQSQFNDLYIRLKAAPPEMPETVTFQAKSYYQLLKEKLAAYLYKDVQSLAVTANGTIDGQSFGKRSVVLLDMNRQDDPAYGDYYLTPYFRTSNALMMEWDRAWTKSVNTHAFSVAVNSLKALTSVYAPNGVIFQTLAGTSNLQDKINSVDDKLGKVFSQKDTHHDELAPIDPTRTKGFAVYFNGSEKSAINVEFEYRESLLSGSSDGKAANIPSRTESIRGWKQPDGTMLKTIIQAKDGQDSPLDQLNKNNADGYAQFCARASDLLASKGYNYIDSAAILYAFLKDSPWNTNVVMRDANDSCITKISDGLNKIGKKEFMLPKRADLVVDISNGRIKIVDKLKADGGMWQSAIPANFASPSAQFMNSFAADEITLLSVKNNLQLTDSILLKAGIPVSYSVSQLTKILRDAKLTYNKNKAIKDGTVTNSCFSIDKMLNSRFRGFCFYPQDGDQALTIEFGFNGDFSSEKDAYDPSLNQLTFFPSEVN
ncbi:hypothetical protein ACIPEN_07495 [Herbaspirillum chlorophenolicum]|uniref:Lipoprotein n=1 Tax=Herbaspirillum chlorophenolicum TaxID=211589 RepID=A0ABW8EXW1_9BURK